MTDDGRLRSGVRTALELYRDRDMTAREGLSRELDEALRERRVATAWMLGVGIGPAALVAVLLAAFVDGSFEVVFGLALLGMAALMLRLVRAHRRVSRLERELEDPIDGS